MKEREKMFKALKQNYDFKNVKSLPTIDYVYPDFTADGLTEEFRFSANLRRELSQGRADVENDLEKKDVIYTVNDDVLHSLDAIIPRLELASNGSAIYPYGALLFVGVNDEEFTSYIVRPVVDQSMAWFRLTNEEQTGVREYLEEKSNSKPYRSLLQRLKIVK